MLTIGERIRALRTKLNLKQEEFAIKINLKRGNLAMIESGKSNPRYETLQFIVKRFDVSADYFFTTDDQYIDGFLKHIKPKAQKRYISDMQISIASDPKEHYKSIEQRIESLENDIKEIKNLLKNK